MELLVAQLLNGLVYGVLLFLMAAGLSLIFGLMNVVSLAHGSFFMLGAFFGLAIFQLTGSFWLALRAGADPGRRARRADGAVVPAAALSPRPHGPGAADLRLHLRVLRSGADGVGPRGAAAAGAGRRCRARCRSGSGVFSTYRLFLIGFGFAIALLLWLLLERSRIGAMVRAGVDNAAMAAGLGANIPALFTGIFGFGVALAALGGVAAGAGARPLSRHGRRNPDPGLHRHRDRRHGQPARRLRRQPADRHRRHLRQSLFPEHRAVPDLSGDDRRAADPAAGPVRHQIFRRRRGVRRRQHQRAGDACRRAPAGLLVLAALLVLPFLLSRLSTRAGRGDLHLRDLRHEPRPAARLHRPDVARPRRVLRPRRLCGRGARRACSASTPGSGLLAGVAAGGAAAPR